MSNLLVQTIKHTNNTSAQTIDTSGRTTAVLNNDTTYRSDAGAVTQNMVQGLAKGWIRFNGESTVAINDSLNMSSLSDNDNGYYSPNYTNNFNSGNTSITICSDRDSSNHRLTHHFLSSATNTNTIYMVNKDNTAADADKIAESIHGDLA